MFSIAGRIDLPWLWGTLCILTVSHMACVMLLRHDPELIRERFKPGPGQPLWDRIFLWVCSVVFLANLIVVALDVGRFHVSDNIPVTLRGMGLISIAVGMAVMTWAMLVNTYFSKVVRIQSDRGQHVIRSGPYRFVRHPGYVGVILWWLGFNLGIGSWMGVAFAVVVGGLFVYRTVREDRFLCEKLDGYTDYAASVRWRLIPGIW